MTRRGTLSTLRPAANKIIFQLLFLWPAAARTHHPHHQSSAGCCWAPILSYPIIQTTTRNIMSFIHAFILKCSLHIINTTHRCVLYSLWPWILTRRNPCHQQFIERNSSWECSHRKYWIKIPFVTVKYLNICNNKSIWAGYQGSAARWGAGTRWTVRTGASNTISIIYCPWSKMSTRWDRSMRCKRTDQSAAAVVCLMSLPANGKRAFTYVRLQRTDWSQRALYMNFCDPWF